jgi:hypothetical protein
MQVEIDVLEFHAPAVEPREIEHVVEHAEQAARGLIEHLGIARLRRVERAGKQQLSHGGDRLHGRPKLMADHGEQLGLRLVGRLGDLAGAPLGGEPVDQPLNLREQIVGPKILRSHNHLPPLSKGGQDGRDHLKVG